jgi:hypothetical protein
MRLELRHLRHPLRTAKAARFLVAERLERRRFADSGEHFFASDPRYDLRRVTEGFSDRVDDEGDDTAVLERICAAYIKAATRESSASEAYQATGWWEQQRYGSLGAVTGALTTRDIDSLRAMYRNFYRDPCSAGLIVLQRAAKDYFGDTIKDLHLRYCLADALFRLDYWKTMTEDRFATHDLSGPGVGNPFGVMVEGSLIRTGSEYQHYCAFRIGRLLSSGASIVAEIGGGFGGMAYYLLRDRAGTTYINFDVPESVALMSYYLMKAFPSLKFLLYGEEELTEDAIARADVVLMPVFEMKKMPEKSVDVTFSSHAMSDLSHEALVEYLNNIARMTRGSFFCIGHDRSGDAMRDLISRNYPSFELEDERVTGWQCHRVPSSGELERLYKIRV